MIRRNRNFSLEKKKKTNWRNIQIAVFIGRNLGFKEEEKNYIQFLIIDSRFETLPTLSLSLSLLLIQFNYNLKWKTTHKHHSTHAGEENKNFVQFFFLKKRKQERPVFYWRGSILLLSTCLSV